MSSFEGPHLAPPPTTKGQATRERIVRAAAQLMFDQGVAGTSTPAIRDAAGVSSSQIYHYFANKQALTSAVIEYQTEAVVGGQEQLLARLDSVEALRAWRDMVVGVQRSMHWAGGCPLGSLASELAGQDADARTALAASFSRWSDAIRDGLARMAERGALRPEADPDSLALALLAALQGGLLLGQAQRSSAALEAGLDAVIALIAQHVADRRP
ncbi:TetR/AcrR family transcriptional regulator [Streptomyces sp. SID10853]|uniref:TetR/AcrR family transcriptional regulator n=1 Tax=Streptomyces sp. SID10853 TaxID=2706028 RepID=UPI0013C1905D|nr:TetR/AcrR family transcriptional regulator [Streptomyces sp. SID10853]NDZ79627.1 TetR/AcrR family transcriptional regulator [Streptomyces sp. SID10853]